MSAQSPRRSKYFAGERAGALAGLMKASVEAPETRRKPRLLWNQIPFTSKRSGLAEAIDLCARSCASTFSGNGASR